MVYASDTHFHSAPRSVFPVMRRRTAVEGPISWNSYTLQRGQKNFITSVNILCTYRGEHSRVLWEMTLHTGDPQVQLIFAMSPWGPPGTIRITDHNIGFGRRGVLLGQALYLARELPPSDVPFSVEAMILGLHGERAYEAPSAPGHRLPPSFAFVLLAMKYFETRRWINTGSVDQLRDLAIECYCRE